MSFFFPARFHRVVRLVPLLLLCATAYAEPAGRVVAVNGSVFVNEKPTKPGDIVNGGDVVRTGEKSSVKLLMRDRSIFDLGPSTTFRIAKYEVGPQGRDVDTTLETGDARASIAKDLKKKPKFYLRTKWSVLAVRGTEFRVVADNPMLVVREGSVEVRSAHNEWRSFLVGTGGQLRLGGSCIHPSGSCVTMLSPAEAVRVTREIQVTDGRIADASLSEAGTRSLTQELLAARELASDVKVRRQDIAALSPVSVSNGGNGSSAPTLPGTTPGGPPNNPPDGTATVTVKLLP